MVLSRPMIPTVHVAVVVATAVVVIVVITGKVIRRLPQTRVEYHGILMITMLLLLLVLLLVVSFEGCCSTVLVLANCFVARVVDVETSKSSVGLSQFSTVQYS
jgi:hypothetical protein